LRLWALNRLAERWEKHGSSMATMFFGARNPADPKYAGLPKDRVKPPAEAVDVADIVVVRRQRF